jgi:hypothetical protein
VSVDGGVCSDVAKLVEVVRPGPAVSFDECVGDGDGGETMHGLVEEGEADVTSMVLQCLPAQVLKHGCDTAAPRAVAYHKPSCSTLHPFQLHDVFLEICRDVNPLSLKILITAMKNLNF